MESKVKCNIAEQKHRLQSLGHIWHFVEKHIQSMNVEEMLSHYQNPAWIEMCILQRPGCSVSPPHPAAGRPGRISILQHFLPSTPLISRSHSTPSCLRTFISLCLSLHFFCLTVCVFISVSVFNENVVFWPQADSFDSFSLLLCYLLLSFFCLMGSTKNVHTLFDNLIYPKSDTVLLLEYCHQWKDLCRT